MMTKRTAKYILILFLGLHFLFPGRLISQEVDRVKALWVIQNFCPSVNWTNEGNITRFTIGVYGNSTGVYDELVKLSTFRQIKNRSFKVEKFRRIKDIKYTHILYVEPTSNNDVKNIFEKLNYNTLLVTDQSDNVEYSMINLRDLQKDRQKYQVNKQNAGDYGITFEKEIYMHGGTEVELRDILKQVERDLKRQRSKLEKQQRELDRQKSQLQGLKDENKKERDENARQKQVNDEQKAEIVARQNEIEEQRLYLSRTQEDLAVQLEKLAMNTRILDEQEKKMIEAREEVRKKNEDIKKQQEEIAKNKKVIKTKDTEIDEQGFLIRFQRIVLFVFIALLGVIILLAFYIWRGYRIKQKINDELRVKNVAINKQREEILDQHRQTDLLNKELERLSIVAARTENAVTIMDKNGNFEWVNVGYTRMYGYTLQLLTHEVDENIVGVSQHSDIEAIIKECIESKKTQVFESKNKTRNGKEVWSQTSLTPILDTEGNISKLITVETDISEVKKAEREIREQHAKILEQSNELEETNKELEKLSLVASETENAISIMDAAGNFQWVNDGFSRLYGYSFNQLLNEYSKNIITQDTNKEIVELIKTCIEQGKPTSYELLQKTRNGNDVWVQSTLTPIKNKEGDVQSLIGISSDISKLKRAEQAMRQLSEELMAQKEEITLQKDQIEQQNTNITASIGYAKTIQTAILPPASALNAYYDAYVVYKPKDIVSGDFYWHSYLKDANGKKDIALYAAVDCTGHGVPGAFMSMIGSSLLNEIVNEKKITQPSKILDMMNHEIKVILRQEQTENDDGMDVCLCALEHVQNGTVKMTFSGAKRPLYYFKNNEGAIEYIKGTRKSIGGTKAKRNQEEFIDHEIYLEKGDCVYLSTDGIVDQPSPERVRFGSVRFTNLLKQIGDKPLEIQKQVVEKAILSYQDHEDQRDDVTFIGLKI